ncbi:XRE family transcriptional regulator [Emcibacter sp. SYSU 3D8]|uniref:XRE family transcriptional regulator n=1 Tax=Emcibacter sp. SYSU 3D8 TaxID=3133969 RepID=UPI0031FEE4B3
MTDGMNEDTRTTFTSLLEYLEFAFERSPKTHAEIAHEMGYRSENVLTMMLAGICKVPIDKVPSLARALNVEPSHMMTLALEDYCPAILRAMEETFDHIATPNQKEWLKVVRHISGDTDPRITPDIRGLLEEHFRNNVVTQG